MEIKTEQIAAGSKKDVADAFIAAYLELFNDPKNLLYLSFSNIPFTREQIQNWFKQSAEDGVEYYAARVENGKIAGILVIRFNITDSFEILAVVVHEKYRGRGVGSLLLQTALGIAREKGFRSAGVAIFADNQNMLSLAVRHGFKPVGIEYRKRFDGEDIVFLKKYMIETE